MKKRAIVEEEKRTPNHELARPLVSTYIPQTSIYNLYYYLFSRSTLGRMIWDDDRRSTRENRKRNVARVTEHTSV